MFPLDRTCFEFPIQNQFACKAAVNIDDGGNSMEEWMICPKCELRRKEVKEGVEGAREVKERGSWGRWGAWWWTQGAEREAARGGAARRGGSLAWGRRGAELSGAGGKGRTGGRTEDGGPGARRGLGQAWGAKRRGAGARCLRGSGALGRHRPLAEESWGSPGPEPSPSCATLLVCSGTRPEEERT